MKNVAEFVVIVSLVLHHVVANIGTENEIYTGCGFEPVPGQPQALKFCNAYGQCIKTQCGADHTFSKQHCGCIKSLQIPPQSQHPHPSQIQSNPRNKTSDEWTKPPPGSVIEVILGSADGLFESSVPPDARNPPPIRKQKPVITTTNESFMSSPENGHTNEGDFLFIHSLTSSTPSTQTSSTILITRNTNTSSSSTPSTPTSTTTTNKTTPSTPTSTTSTNKTTSSSNTQKTKITFPFTLTAMELLTHETTKRPNEINTKTTNNNKNIPPANFTANKTIPAFPNPNEQSSNAALLYLNPTEQSLQLPKSTTTSPGYSQTLTRNIQLNNTTLAPSVATLKNDSNLTTTNTTLRSNENLTVEDIGSFGKLNALPETVETSRTSTQTSPLISTNLNILSTTSPPLTTETTTNKVQVSTHKSSQQDTVTSRMDIPSSSTSPAVSSLSQVGISVHAEGSSTENPLRTPLNITNTERELACGSEVNITGISYNNVLTGEGSSGFLYIGARGVTSNNGSIHFDGRSIFWIPFYEGNRFTSGITVIMTFKEDITFQNSQGLVGNCGGEAGPSFSITLYPQRGRVKFKALVMSTKTPYPFQETLEVSVPYTPGTVKTLEMQCSGQKLVGRVDTRVAGTHVPSTEDYELSPRSKPLFVGTGCPEEETENFHGDVNTFAVYRCVRAET